MNRQPKPNEVELYGPIVAEDIERYKQEKDRVYGIINRAPQWLVQDDRQLRIGEVISNSVIYEDKYSYDKATHRFTLALLYPFWSSVNEESINNALAVGVNNFNFTNDGDRATFPIFEISGDGITDVVITEGNRNLTWSGALGIGQTLVIDCLNATVSIGISNEIVNVADGSQFIRFKEGGN